MLKLVAEGESEGQGNEASPHAENVLKFKLFRSQEKAYFKRNALL